MTYPPGFARYDAECDIWVVDCRAAREGTPGWETSEAGIGSWEWYLKAYGAPPPSDWEVSLHLRPTPNAADDDSWVSPAQGTHAVSIGPGGDLEPTSTSRCIVMRVKCTTAAADFRFIGKAADSPHYGAAITAMDIRGTDAASMSPEDIVADIVDDLTTTAQRHFPDASGLTVGQLDFTEPTTRYDMLEAVNEILRWQHGFGPNRVFTYRRPYALNAVPDRACYDVPYTLFAPSVTLPIDDLWNACEVSYVDKKDRQRVYRHSWTNSAIPAGVTRRQEIQAPDHVHNAGQAQTVAEAFAADHSGDVPTGTVPLVGMVPLVDGRERHALHARPGEYVYLRDAPSESVRLLRITRVEKTPATQECVAEVGRNPNRLDRLLKRWDTGTKRRRRRK